MVFRTLLFCCMLEWAPLAVAGSPYARIYQRNVFRLKPAAAAHSVVSHEPLPKVHLTGITTILRGKRALLKVEFPAKPYQKTKEESYILTEGQKSGPVEVLEIDDKKAEVKIDNSGTVTTLKFEELGPKPAPPPATQPLPQWRGSPPARFRR